MNEEIEFLREHIKGICSYKGLQQELTYDISLDILKRVCLAFDYLQQENKQLRQLNKIIYVDKSEHILEELKKYLEDDWSSVNGEIASKLILDKIKELEEGVK